MYGKDTCAEYLSCEYMYIFVCAERIRGEHSCAENIFAIAMYVSTCERRFRSHVRRRVI